MDILKIPAPAKINLALDIRGLLPDGYHRLATVMQSIAIHDLVTLRVIPGGISVDSSNPDLPRGEENLAYRAAELFFKESAIKGGVEIFIEKKIPIAAGLAGGSTDAAAVLKGLNDLYETNHSIEQLKEMGGRLGADVPFCIEGGTALATGKGDRLEQLPDLTGIELILVVPPVEVSTATIYRKYDQLKLHNEIPVEYLVKLLKEQKEINWTEGWANILEEVTIPLVEEIAEIKEKLGKMGAVFTLMSGSGPAVFAVIENRSQAEEIQRRWPREKDRVYLSKTTGKDFPQLW